MDERGMASWYGRKFHGRRTSSGEPYNMFAMSAAHTTMPIPSYARVRNPANGREVIVKVNDRGPFVSDRVMDLSWAAASKLGISGRVSMVEVQRLTQSDIVALGGSSGRGSDAMAGGTPRGAPVSVVSTMPGRTAPVTAPVYEDEPAVPTPVRTPSVTTTVVTVPGGSTRPGTPAAPAVTAAAPAPGFWLQLGAFSRPEGAQTLQRNVAGVLDWMAPVLKVFSDGSLSRVQAGPYRTRDEANAVAGRVRNESSWVPMVVERR
jgi:rare lipoprotein A